MSNSPMFYREEAPSFETSHFVLSYWEFRISNELEAPVMHEVFPEGCVTIIYNRNLTLSTEMLLISSINPKSIYVPLQPGDTMYGMRILPEAGAKFFNQNPAEIQTQPYSKTILGSRFSEKFLEQLNASKDFSAIIEAFEMYVKEFGVRRDEIDARLAKATQIFIKSEGLAKVSETARAIGLSERQFERNYRKASGLSPKQFARICRFRATAVDLVKNSFYNWANRAADKGFTDQSHLNREFSTLSGNSPIEFSANVKRIEHGKLIE